MDADLSGPAAPTDAGSGPGRALSTASGLDEATARAVHRMVEPLGATGARTLFRRMAPIDEWLAVATSPSYFTAIAWDGGEPVAVVGVETDPRRTALDPRRLETWNDGPCFVATLVAVHPDHKPAGVLEEVVRAAAAFSRDQGARLLMGAPAGEVETGFAELVALVLRDQLAMPVVEVDRWQLFSIDLRPPDR